MNQVNKHKQLKKILRCKIEHTTNINNNSTRNNFLFST